MRDSIFGDHYISFKDNSFDQRDQYEMSKMRYPANPFSAILRFVREHDRAKRR